MNTTKKFVEIKPYNLKELASIYGVSVRTVKIWITMHQLVIGRKKGRLYTALQVKIIFEKLGLPGLAED